MEEEKGVCCPRALNFPHPPSRQSWASPEPPLLAFSVCTAGFEARSCGTYIQNKYPCPSCPWYSSCAAPAACSPCPESCRTLRNRALKHTLPHASHQDTGNGGWKVPSARPWMLISVCREEEQRGVTGLALCSSLRSRHWFLNGALALRQTSFAFTKNRGVGLLFFLYQSV